MEIIKSSYPDRQDFPLSRILICDLHFDAKDILKKTEKTVLADGALPKHLCVFCPFYDFVAFSFFNYTFGC